MLTDYLETVSGTTDIDYSDTREILSWVLTSILMITILFNSLYALFNLALRVIAYCRRVRERNKQELKENSKSYRREHYI
jgi:biopolymer transport protein ExbB/TolQ